MRLHKLISAGLPINIPPFEIVLSHLESGALV